MEFKDLRDTKNNVDHKSQDLNVKMDSKVKTFTINHNRSIKTLTTVDNLLKHKLIYDNYQFDKLYSDKLSLILKCNYKKITLEKIAYVEEKL